MDSTIHHLINQYGLQVQVGAQVSPSGWLALWIKVVYFFLHKTVVVLFLAITFGGMQSFYFRFFFYCILVYIIHSSIITDDHTAILVTSGVIPPPGWNMGWPHPHAPSLAIPLHLHSMQQCALALREIRLGSVCACKFLCFFLDSFLKISSMLTTLQSFGTSFIQPCWSWVKWGEYLESFRWNG